MTNDCSSGRFNSVLNLAGMKADGLPPFGLAAGPLMTLSFLFLTLGGLEGGWIVA